MIICPYSKLNGRPFPDGTWFFSSGTTQSNPTPPTIYNGCMDFTGYQYGLYTYGYYINNPFSISYITINYKPCCDNIRPEPTLNLTGCTSDLPITFEVTDYEIKSINSLSGQSITTDNFVIEIDNETEITITSATTINYPQDIVILNTCVSGECPQNRVLFIEMFNNDYQSEYNYTACTDSSSIFLFNDIGVPPQFRDGLWTAQSQLINQTNFNTLTGEFNPNLPADTYTLIYEKHNIPCGDIDFTVNITVSGAYQLEDEIIEVCRGETVDLNTILLSANTQTVNALPIGTWSNFTNTGCNPILIGSFTPATGIFDTTLNQVATYCFKYTITSTDPNCPNITETFVTVNVVDCI